MKLRNMASFSCPICFESKYPYLLNCEHSLCVACVEKFKNDGISKCPICRSIITTYIKNRALAEVLDIEHPPEERSATGQSVSSTDNLTSAEDDTVSSTSGESSGLPGEPGPQGEPGPTGVSETPVNRTRYVRVEQRHDDLPCVKIAIDTLNDAINYLDTLICRDFVGNIIGERVGHETLFVHFSINLITNGVRIINIFFDMSNDFTMARRVNEILDKIADTLRSLKMKIPLYNRRTLMSIERYLDENVRFTTRSLEDDRRVDLRIINTTHLTG